MSGIEFNEQPPYERIHSGASSDKGMVGWLIKKGFAQNADIGNYILVGVAVFFFLMSALMFYIL